MVTAQMPGLIRSGMYLIAYTKHAWRFLPMVVFFTFLHQSAQGQHQELQEKPLIWQRKSGLPSLTDSTSLLDKFRKGKINGHIRYFYSKTLNQGELTDYFAHALGGGIRFETASWHGVQAGISGFYIFNLASSALAEKDPLANQTNRYEVGLFDVTDPANTSEINRLEELFLKYQRGGTKLTLGRQLLNTPFINLQDGRMRPTAVQGGWFEHQFHSHHFIQGGWLNGMAPRGTRKWYSLDSSIGLYPAGVGIDGRKSAYPGQVTSSGAALLNYNYRRNGIVSANVWHLWVQNVMHTSLGQVDISAPSLAPVSFSLQSVLQFKSGTGGNAETTKAYYTNEKPVWTVGARLSAKFRNWEHALAGNYISSAGRYLMPREWGRDPFFTFLPRERNEGYGDALSLLWKSQYKAKNGFSALLAAGYYKLPEIEKVHLNKYSMPSYIQTLLDIRYHFTNFFDGWEVQALYTYKINTASSVLPPNAVFNKVNMHLVNLVVNFRF